MKSPAEAARHRCVAIWTLASVGMVHAIALCGVMLLMQASRSRADRVIPVAPPLQPVKADGVALAPPGLGGAESAAVDRRWSAPHKDTAAPWRVDAQGRVVMRP